MVVTKDFYDQLSESLHEVVLGALLGRMERCNWEAALPTLQKAGLLIRFIRHTPIQLGAKDIKIALIR